MAKNIDKMKSLLVKEFENYIVSLNEDGLAAFIGYLDILKFFEIPKGLWNCEICKELNGTCAYLMDKSSAGKIEKAHKLCKERFHNYCQEEESE